MRQVSPALDFLEGKPPFIHRLSRARKLGDRPRLCGREVECETIGTKLLGHLSDDSDRDRQISTSSDVLGCATATSNPFDGDVGAPAACRGWQSLLSAIMARRTRVHQMLADGIVHGDAGDTA